MKTRNIYITENDKKKLISLFSTTIGFRNTDLKTVKNLLSELNRATVVNDESINEFVITMNSTFCVVDLKTKESFIYTLVFPENANSNENKISILAPLGTALLGYSVGDTVEWDVPSGKRRLLVKEILFQPEAAAKSAVNM